MNRIFLSGPQYVLGEIPLDHADITDLPDRARAFTMVPKAELWGWGSVRRTERSLEALAVESGRASLKAVEVDPDEVDCLVLCCTGFPGGPNTHGAFVDEVMTGLGLRRAAFTGVTLNRCTNLLAGVRLAEALVASGRQRRVLVVTTDRIADESLRMENFALFSDGAAACVVAAEPSGSLCFEVLGSASAQRPGALDWSNEISPELSSEVNDRLLGPLGLALDSIDRLLHLNLHTPIVVLKERQAGFTREQLFTGNITRIGHCFAADPLINLVDLHSGGELRTGGRYLLAASVPGARIGVLLRHADEGAL